MEQISINEEWRSIDGNIDYQISNIGRVRNCKTGKILKPSLRKDGYYMVGLSYEGKCKPHKIHRLVAHEFLVKPDMIHHYVVDHINGETTNNKVNNLRYATLSQNQMNRVKHTATEIGSTCKGVFKDKKKWRALFQYQGQRYHLGNYDGEEDAANAYNKKAIELAGEFAYINIIRGEK